MRVLVTGGAGYIGSVTVRTLLDCGTEVAVLDSLERGHREALDERAVLVVGDVGDAAACDAALAGCDAVVHCAGYIEVAESVELPDRYHDNNVVRPRVLLDRMEAAGVAALVFSSSAAVYGEPERVPIAEDDATLPVNPYGESKLAFEREVAGRRSAGLRCASLRYFNAAGAWPDGSLGEAHNPETHLVPRILAAIAGGRREFEVFGGDYPTRDGTCVRDYVHVTDLASAHALAVEHLVAGGDGGAFNLGSGEGFTNREVVEACAEVTGRDVDIAVGARRAGDPAVLVASSAKAREVLGWAPARGSLKTVIGDAWRWHSSHPEGYRSG